jgi:hypothetical protein
MTKCQSKVVTEGFHFGIVTDGLDESLLIGLTSSEPIETDLVFGMIDFNADQSMRPEGINRVSTFEDFDRTASVCATQEDDCPLER